MASRTMLEIASDAADVSGVGAPASLIGNRDPGARAIVSLLNRAGNNMARMRNTWGGGWTALTREFSFQTVAGQEAYALPSDYQALVDGTVWDRTEFREARGTLSPQQWQRNRSGLIDTVTLAPYYRLRRGAGAQTQIFLDPVPGEADELVLEYVSDEWIRNGEDASQYRSRMGADTDVPLLPDDLLEMSLIWRFKEAQGLTFAAQLAEYELEAGRRMADDAVVRPVNIGRGIRRRWPNFGSDTNFGIP